jgi:hypothetical protein
MEPVSTIPPPPPPPPPDLGHPEIIWPWVKFIERRRAVRKAAAEAKKRGGAGQREDASAGEAG